MTTASDEDGEAAPETPATAVAASVACKVEPATEPQANAAQPAAPTPEADAAVAASEPQAEASTQASTAEPVAPRRRPEAAAPPEPQPDEVLAQMLRLGVPLEVAAQRHLAPSAPLRRPMQQPLYCNALLERAVHNPQRRRQHLGRLDAPGRRRARVGE